jgi:N-acetylmuramoyl-L-alanine amidase
MSRRRETNQITQIIIHCADTPNGQWFEAHQIDDWHKSRGFKRDKDLAHSSKLKHIGYHYVIYTNGAVIQGRADNETGAHAKGHNSSSIGICLMGRDKFGPDQFDSLKSLIKILQRTYPTIKKVIGHRAVNPHKTCPGYDVDAWLKNNMYPLLNTIYLNPRESKKCTV